MNLIRYVLNMTRHKLLSLQVLSFWICTIFMAAGSFSDDSELYFLMLEEEIEEGCTSPFSIDTQGDIIDTDPETWRPKDVYSKPVFQKFKYFHSPISTKAGKVIFLVKTMDISILTNAP